MKKQIAINLALVGPSRAAVIYARVSSRDQEKEGFSIPAQLESLRAYADAQGFTICKEFVDVETAKQAGRTGFGEMIAFLKKHPSCRTVLVEKTDRLYRNFKDYVTIDELGIDVHFVKENVVLSKDSRSHEKFMHGIKVLMAKNYIDNLSEEVRKGLHQKAREGMWPTVAPIGYLNALGEGGKKTIVLDPALASAVRRLFERYATGNHSLKQIAKLARADGLVYRKSGASIPTSTVHRILRKQVYSGDFDYNGVLYHGTYEPLITPELWQQVQDVLDGRHAKRPKKETQNFAFSGLITCGHCGCAMVGEIKKGRYVYYHCTGYKGKCPEPYTREEVLEKSFTTVLKGIAFSTEVLAWVTTALRESHQDEKQFHDEAISKLQREQRRLQDRIDAMYADKLDGRIDNAFFDRKAGEARSEQCRIMRDIEAHQTANTSYIEEGIKLLELSQRAAQLFESQPPSEKRKLLDFVLSNSRWKDGKLEAEYRQPFDLIAAAALADRQLQPNGGSGNGNFDEWRRGGDSNPR
uniref:Recombinase n=1 Tax=Solibacter usitatus (strain Ellin6076) TaxID=234267 RepID=Q028A0_SOLUE